MTQRAILAAALLLAGLFPWFGCKGKNPEPPPRVPTVTVQHPVERQVTEYLDMTGSVAPSQTVSLVARVPGYLESVNFQDGSFVEKGRLLFVIEPEPYVEQLRLAEAQLERARAEYKRQLVMLKENATSAANVERWKSQRDQAAAQVELAKINLGYTRVTAPFSGRIGKRLVDPGNMVGTGGSTALATLDQFDPIYVDFSVNERDALRVRDTVRRLGHKAGNPDVPVPVFVGLLDEEGTPHRGTLDFVDNGVNTSTGTIQTRAIFQNSDRDALPRGLCPRAHSAGSAAAHAGGARACRGQ